MSPSPHRSVMLSEHIEIPRSPTLPSELTMAKYRIIVEDEKTGQEIKGYSKLSRAGVDLICALIDSVGAHELRAGNVPWRKGAHSDYRAARKWAVGVRRALDEASGKPARKAPQPAPKVMGRYARLHTGR